MSLFSRFYLPVDVRFAPNSVHTFSDLSYAADAVYP